MPFTEGGNKSNSSANHSSTSDWTTKTTIYCNWLVGCYQSSLPPAHPLWYCSIIFFKVNYTSLREVEAMVGGLWQMKRRWWVVGEAEVWWQWVAREERGWVLWCWRVTTVAGGDDGWRQHSGESAVPLSLSLSQRTSATPPIIITTIIFSLFVFPLPLNCGCLFCRFYT